MNKYYYEKADKIYTVKNKEKYHRALAMLILSIALIAFGMILILNSIKVSNDGVSYNEKGRVDYKVYLKENNYYESNYLDRDMQYIASLINTINADFKYEMHSTNELKYNYSYKIIGTIKVTDKVNVNKILYSKDEVLKEEIKSETNSKYFIINSDVDIDYTKYNDYVNSYKRDYGLSANAYLEVKMLVKVNGKDGNLQNDIDLNEALKIIIPLSEQTIEINSNSINNSNSILYSHKLEISGIIILGIISIVIGLIEFIISINNMMKSKIDPYEKELNRLLKNYDTYIITATNDFKEDKDIVKVEKFNELLDAQKIEQVPIIFYEVEPGNKSYFVLKGEKETYRFTLTRAYQDKIKKNSDGDNK